MDVAAQDSTEVDIYADLPTFKYDETLDQLKKSEAQLLHNNGKLQKLVEEKACEIDQLKIKLRNLELNISSLLKTARSEISRKDKTISDLRTQICELRRSSVPASPRTLSNHLLTSVISEQTKGAANIPLKAPVTTILQPNVPVRTLFSARALQRIRAEDNARNASPPTAPSKELEASRSDEVAQAPNKEFESSQNERLEPTPEESRVIKPAEVGHVSDDSEKVAPGAPTAANGERKLNVPPSDSSVVVHSSCSMKDLRSKPSDLHSNNEINSSKPTEVLPKSVHLEGAEKVSSTTLAPKQRGTKSSQVAKPAIKSPKPPEHSHFTRLRSRTKPQINVSPISSVWSQKSKRTSVKITKADPPKKPDTLVVPRSTKPSVVDLFGSPVKWSENSSDVVPFDITSPAVFEDSVITQTDCAERLNPTAPFSNPMNEPNIATTQSDARKSHFLRDEPTLAEPASTNFESTTQFVSALTKTYTQISPLKSPRSSNSLSLPQENNPDKASSIPRLNFNHESLRPESTSQPVPSLMTTSSPISVPKSPVASKSPAGKEAAPENLPVAPVEPSKPSPPAAPSIFNLQSQTSINIFSKNLTTKRDFSDKPINILQPRKTPRIIGTTKSCPSSSFPAKPSSLLTPSEPLAAKIAISESFLSEQEKRVRHWQKEKLFCHSFSVGEGSNRQAPEIHHMTEVVYSPKILASCENPIAPPARNKAKDEEATGAVAPPKPVSNCPEIIEKPKQMPFSSAVSPKPVVESNEVLSKASLTSLKPTPRTSNFKRSSALKITPKAADGSGDQRTRFEIMADTRVDTLYKPRKIENYSTKYYDKRSSREHNSRHASNMKDRSAGNVTPQEKREPKVAPIPRESPVTLPSTKLVVRPRKTVQLQSTTPSSTVHFTYGNECKPETLSTTPVSTSRSSALKVSVTVTDFLEPSPISHSPRLKTPSLPNHVVSMTPTSQQNGEEKARAITTPSLRRMKKRKINLSCVTQSSPHKVFVYGKDS